MHCTTHQTLFLPALILAMVWGAGCVSRQPTGSVAPGSPQSRSAFAIRLHCEPEDDVATWHEEQLAAEEHERLFGEQPAAPVGEPGQDEDCDDLVEAFRDGAEALLSEARFDRVRNR